MLSDDRLPPGTLCRHRLGALVRVIGPAVVVTERARLRCEVLDPGPTTLRTGQRATFRVDWLTAL